MLIQILHLASIFLHTPIVSGLYYRIDFCNKFPNTYYCEKELPSKVDVPKCGTQISNVEFLRLDYLGFVKQINTLRKEMANGYAVSNGKSFPTVGDMVILEWSDELEKAAKNSVRHCFSGNEGDSPDKEKRSVPSIDGSLIGVQFYQQFSSERIDIDPAQELNKAFEGWRKDEINQLAGYTSHKGILKDSPALNLIIYGKQRLIGCGNVFFESADSDPIVYKVFGLCYISPASLSTSTLMVLGVKACTACQPKTECAKKGPFAKILCAYTGDGMRLQRSWIYIANALLFVTLI